MRIATVLFANHDTASIPNTRGECLEARVLAMEDQAVRELPVDREKVERPTLGREIRNLLQTTDLPSSTVAMSTVQIITVYYSSHKITLIARQILTRGTIRVRSR